MKIILLKNIESIGLPGELAEVREGYYRNYLQPRGMAVTATPSNLKHYEAKRVKLHKEAEVIVSEARALGEKIEGETLTFVEKVSESDRLFGSVTPGDIAKRLNEAGFEIDRRQVILGEPLKTLGTFSATIRMNSKVSVAVKVVIENEAGPEEEAAEERPKETAVEEEAKSEAAEDAPEDATEEAPESAPENAKAESAEEKPSD